MTTTAGADRFAVHNPFDQSVVGEVQLGGAIEVAEACVNAQAVSEAVLAGDIPQHLRAQVLDQAVNLLKDSRLRFADLISQEVGKPITLAQAEVDRCIETLRFSAVEARMLAGELVAADATAAGAGALALALRVPIGVVGAITPFNFPLNLVAHKVGPAIAAGCPVVLKPAPQAPLTSVAFAELLLAAGLPAGYLAVVPDTQSEAGAALVAHEVPRMLSFTGSVQVGWAIAREAYRKKIALELGSASATIVAPDADLEHAADRIVAGGFGFAGQSCVAVQNVYVHRSRHRELLTLLGKRVKRLRVGDPADPDTQVGPVINQAACERITDWVQQAVSDGATLIAGGDATQTLMTPTLVDSPAEDTKLVTQEVFGPVVSVLPVDSLEAAIQRINERQFTLQVGVFTSDLSAVLTWVAQIRAGGIIVNDVRTTRLDNQPYGGIGEAGNTREGPAHTVHEMTELKFVSLRSAPRGQLTD